MPQRCWMRSRTCIRPKWRTLASTSSPTLIGWLPNTLRGNRHSLLSRTHRCKPNPPRSAKFSAHPCGGAQPEKCRHVFRKRHREHREAPGRRGSGCLLAVKDASSAGQGDLDFCQYGDGLFQPRQDVRDDIRCLSPDGVAQGLRFLARQEFDQMTIDIGQPAPPPQLGVLRQPRFRTVLKMHAGSAPAAGNPGVACQGFPVRTICFRSDNSPLVISAVSDRSVCFFCRTCCCWFLDFGRRFSELDRPI